MKTLLARTLTEAKKELRALAVHVDRGEAVAPTRLKFEQVAQEFLSNFESLVAAGERSPRTLERYREHLDHHILPSLGRREIQKVTPDVLARFLREKRDLGLSDWSRKGMLTPLGRIFSLAVRRGYIFENPLRRLDSSELPKGQNRNEARVLNRDELTALVKHAPETYRPVIATLVYTGLRIQEALGLVWADVDFDAGLIRVRHQVTRATRDEPARRVKLKTRGSRREIRLEPDLAALLRRHKLASAFSQDDDFVFTTSDGTPFYYRNVAVRGLDKAAEAAGLNHDGLPKLSFHDLRHTYGSHLIRQGLDVVRISRQLGHARPSITLDVYAHEFEQAQHADDVNAKLTAAFGGIILPEQAHADR
jgi:integrase